MNETDILYVNIYIRTSKYEINNQSTLDLNIHFNVLKVKHL